MHHQLCVCVCVCVYTRQLTCIRASTVSCLCTLSVTCCLKGAYTRSSSLTDKASSLIAPSDARAAKNLLAETVVSSGKNMICSASTAHKMCCYMMTLMTDWPIKALIHWQEMMYDIHTWWVAIGTVRLWCHHQAFPGVTLESNLCYSDLPQAIWQPIKVVYHIYIVRSLSRMTSSTTIVMSQTILH